MDEEHRKKPPGERAGRTCRSAAENNCGVGDICMGRAKSDEQCHRGRATGY
jgi:hypothetical protein